MTLIECVFIVASTLLLGIAIAGLSTWIYRATKLCLHTYERIDKYEDKKMILVCQRCGKIRKLRK